MHTAIYFCDTEFIHCRRPCICLSFPTSKQLELVSTLLLGVKVLVPKLLVMSCSILVASDTYSRSGIDASKIEIELIHTLPNVNSIAGDVAIEVYPDGLGS